MSIQNPLSIQHPMSIQDPMSIKDPMSIWLNVHPSQRQSVPMSIQPNFHLTQCLLYQFQNWSQTDRPTNRPTYSHCPILEMLWHLKTDNYEFIFSPFPQKDLASGIRIWIVKPKSKSKFSSLKSQATATHPITQKSKSKSLHLKSQFFKSKNFGV